MPLFAFRNRRFRVSLFFISTLTGLLLSALSFAQLNLAYRLLTGYLLSDNDLVNKGKPTLFVFEQADAFEQVFKPTTTGTSRRPNAPDFARDMVIGIALPATNKPPKLSVSKIFVQDSTLTVRYIRMNDTTLTHTPQSFSSQPTLLVVVPRQTVLKTRLIENGKVVETLRRKDRD